MNNRMSRDRLRKALPSIVYLLIAAIFYWQTFSIRQSTSGVIGAITPRTAPRFIILCFAVCAVFNLYNDLKREGETEAFIQVPAKYLAVGAAFLFIALFVKKLGFVVCGVLFLFVLFVALDDEQCTKKRVLVNLLMAVVFSVVLCYGFRYGLNVRIPLYPRL